MDVYSHFIFITSGVSSSLGTSLAASSIALVLKARGMKVEVLKLDPYVNLDASMISPLEHGECFVTADGGQCDMSVGIYEKFLNQRMGSRNFATAGAIYDTVMREERRGAYLGRTVQVVPHITNEIKRRITCLAEETNADFVVVQFGGTVGDIESLPFVEAERELINEYRGRTLAVHYTYIPYLKAAGELKTKPTQHSVHEILAEGVQPDMLVLRSERHLERDMRQKVSRFCNVRPENVFESIDVRYTYELPLDMERAQVAQRIFDHFGIVCEKNAEPSFACIRKLVSALRMPHEEVKVALVCVHPERMDAHRSMVESLVEAAAATQQRLDLTMVAADRITKANVASMLSWADAITVESDPLGLVTEYAMENDMPWLAVGCKMSDEAQPLGDRVVIAETDSVIAHAMGKRKGAQRMARVADDMIHIANKLKATAWFEDGAVAVMESLNGTFGIATSFSPQYSTTIECVHPLFESMMKAVKSRKQYNNI